MPQNITSKLGSSKPAEEEPRIDPDLPVDNVHNREAAKKLRWTYDAERMVYRDSDGLRVADEYGQPL